MTADAEFVRGRLRITCADALGLMTEHLEHALSSDDQDRFRTHLDGCEACAAYLDQLRLTVEVAGTLGSQDTYQVDQSTMNHLVGLYRSTRLTP